MTANAPAWMTEQYSDRAMHIYQRDGNRLRPTVTSATRIEGAEKAHFWLAGKSKAKKKKRGERNTPVNGERKKITATLETWVCFDTVEEYDADRMTVDEREVVYTSGAKALGRSTDAELYATMDAAVPAVAAGLDFSAGAFSAVSAMTLCQKLQEQHVPWDGMAFCGLPPLQWNQLLANKIVNASDHVGTDLPFVKATDTRFWNGVNWFLFVEEEAGELYPVPEANKQDLFIWHKSALGWGNHTDLRVIPQWDNYNDWWTINMQSKGAAVALQEGNGIRRFRTSTNSAIAVV